MDTINTIDDFLQVLDENPKWVEALRARLLSRQLIELPEKFAQFIEATDKRFEMLEQRFENFEQRLDRFIEATDKRFEMLEQRFERLEQRLDRFIEATDKRFERLEQRLDRFIEATDKRFENLEQRFERLEQRLDRFIEATDKRFENLETRVQSIQNDVSILKDAQVQNATRIQSIQNDLGMLKGAHARNAAIGEAPHIAQDMGFNWTTNLSQKNLWDLTKISDTSGIPTNELRSFHRADLIMEATGREGETCYIAVEISFTVNGRDTTRAVRNAGFLTKFTGKPAYAAVVGLRRDDRVQDSIESGQVFWYQLPMEVLQAE